MKMKGLTRVKGLWGFGGKSTPVLFFHPRTQVLTKFWNMIHLCAIGIRFTFVGATIHHSNNYSCDVSVSHGQNYQMAEVLMLK